MDNRADDGTKPLGVDDFVAFRSGLGVGDAPGWLRNQMKERKNEKLKNQMKMNNHMKMKS